MTTSISIDTTQCFNCDRTIVPTDSTSLISRVEEVSRMIHYCDDCASDLRKRNFCQYLRAECTKGFIICCCSAFFTVVVLLTIQSIDFCVTSEGC
jgi:hypothetical protein